MKELPFDRVFVPGDVAGNPVVFDDGLEGDFYFGTYAGILAMLADELKEFVKKKDSNGVRLTAARIAAFVENPGDGCDGN